MTKKTPPHLPPQYCDLKNHYLWGRIKILLFITFFSLLVGLAGASMLLGWIWPNLGNADVWIASYQRPAFSEKQLEERVQKEMSGRIAGVYRAVSNLGTVKFLDPSYKIGDGVIVSTDGWVAVYAPDFVNSGQLYIQAPGGKIYESESVIRDQYAGIVYIKVKADQFKVVNFSDDLKNGDEFYVYQDGNWVYGLVRQELYNLQAQAHMDTAPVKSYSTSGSYKKGNVVINSQGRIVGFMTGENNLVPSVYLSRSLSNFLNKKYLEYPSLGVIGWFGVERPLFVDNKKTDGFLISQIWSAGNLRAGDLILEVNGSVVAEDNLWYIISNNEKVNLKINRNGKLLDLSVAVVKNIIKN